MNRTKEEILKAMEDEMPFNLNSSLEPYILEAMEIYANEKLKNHGVSHHVSKCDWCGYDLYVKVEEDNVCCHCYEK